MNKITTAATPMTIHHTGSIGIPHEFRLASQGALRARNGKRGDWCLVRDFVPNLDSVARKRKKNPLFFLESWETLIIVRGASPSADFRALGSPKARKLPGAFRRQKLNITCAQLTSSARNATVRRWGPLRSTPSSRDRKSVV